MADQSDNLRDTLARLHEQLRAAPNISPETRAALQGAVTDIHALLGEGTAPLTPAASGTARARQESIVARLGSAEREFEATHPTLAGIVGSIIDAVGRMGI
jgi:hypothetical protein